jgi:cytochrome c-type biogenesis protein CcmH/NrfG
MVEAAPLVLQEDLATSRGYLALIVPNESAAYQVGASKILRLTVASWGQEFRVEAVLADTATQRNSAVFAVEVPTSAGLISPLTALARQIDRDASSFSTGSDRALQTFTTAARTPDPATRSKLLSDAITADPKFGFAYVALAEIGIAAGQDVRDLVTRAAAYRASFTPLDRARFQVLESRAAHASLPVQEKALEQVLRFSPNNVEALARVAADRFLQNDSVGGQQYMQRASQLSPGNTNLLKQLAEGLLATRRYAEAEKVFTSINNNPAVLPELAICIFLSGDSARADTVMERFLSLRSPGDPVTALLRASWLALSGRRPQAIAQISNPQSSDDNFRALAFAQVALWQLMDSNSSEAEKYAGLASQTRKQPGLIAAFIAQPNASASQLRQQIGSANGTTGQVLLGYALFLHHFYADAAQTWKALLDQSGGTDLRARSMLASSLERAGQLAQSHSILIQPFAPDLGDLYAAVAFEEMRRLLPR